MLPPTTPIVLSATPTLFTAEGDLAETEIARHYRWLHESGIDAVFIAGTSGEFPTLTDDERLRLLDLALEVFPAEGVYLHVGAAGARQAASITARAAAAGGRRFAAITPFFQPAPEAQVLEYYRALRDAAPDVDLFAYLFEARTSTVSRPDVLPMLADLGLAGVKISGETDQSVAAHLAVLPEGMTLYSGNDVSFGWLVDAGGHGIVSGVSAAYPEPFVALGRAFASGDADAVRRHQAEVARAVTAVRAGSLTHLKAGIEARGFTAGPVRSAVAPVPPADFDTIREVAEQYGDAATR